MKRNTEKTKTSQILFTILALAGAIVTQESNAQPIQLRPHTTRVSIGKPTKILQLNQQVDTWQLNGKTSNQSTFSYRGNNAILTADFATADVVAKCKTVGRETFAISWSLAYNDRNDYTMNYTVDCVQCPGVERPILVPHLPGPGFNNPEPREPVRPHAEEPR